MNKTTIVENQTKENATTSKPAKRIREDKPRKKDEKSLEHVFRALDSLGSTEHKLGAMCQKYAEMYNDHRMLQATVKQAEKKNCVLQKEKEQLQSEHSKAILTRSRLENLCRELQRQNKAVKEECMLKMREEGEKKREVAAKFHSMLSEIGSLLAQNNNKNAKLRDDNLDMSMRLKSVCDQFEKKEQHVENLAKQMELEMQLADAKLAKAKMEMDIEKETLEKEKQQLVIEIQEYKRKLVEMKASELSLREQITMYSEKYEEFHKALLQSNSAIGEFKAEMERMTKHIRRLEKETATWMSRYDGAQRTLAEVSQAKLRSDEALALSQRRLVALQGICRGLQEQCRQLRGEQRRDSQAEEEFKKLEAQIKDVEKSADINYSSCPRNASESLPETTTSQTVEPPLSATNSTVNTSAGSCDATDVTENNLPETCIRSENRISDDSDISNNLKINTSEHIESFENEESSTHIEVIQNCSNTIENSKELECSQSNDSLANVLNSTDNSHTNMPNIEDNVICKPTEGDILLNHVQESSGGIANLCSLKTDNTFSAKEVAVHETELFENENVSNVPIKSTSALETSSITDEIEESSILKDKILDNAGKKININGISFGELSSSTSVANDSPSEMFTNHECKTNCVKTENIPKIRGNSLDEVNQAKNKKKRKSKK